METSREAGLRVDADARKRPWFYVGLAGLFSVVFGFLLGRRTKR